MLEILAYTVLFLTSWAAINMTQKHNYEPILTKRDIVKALIAFLVVGTLSWVLVANSKLSFKYWILAFMIASLLLDAAYMYRHRYKIDHKISQKRFVYQMVDNSLWVVVTTILFLTL